MDLRRASPSPLLLRLVLPSPVVLSALTSAVPERSMLSAARWQRQLAKRSEAPEVRDVPEVAEMLAAAQRPVRLAVPTADLRLLPVSGEELPETPARL